MLFQPLLEQRRDRPRQAQDDEAADSRAGFARGCEDLRHLVSVMAGTTGATITPTGMPAFASVSMAASRSSGVAARGSMMPRDFGSSVVTETKPTSRRISRARRR